MSALVSGYGSSDESGDEAAPAVRQSHASFIQPVVAAPEVSTENPMELRMMIAKPTDTQIMVNTSYSDLSRPEQGPMNPFNQNSSIKRNVLTGAVETQTITDAMFNAQQRTYNTYGYARDPSQNAQGFVGNQDLAQQFEGSDIIERKVSKAELAALKAKREKKGDASVLEGDNRYLGPWAAYKHEEIADEDEMDDGEYADEAMAPESNPVIVQDRDADAYNTSAEEKTEFHGSEMYDYQGRTYMHVPQDLDVNLLGEPGEQECFVPKKLVHTWEAHAKAVSAVRFFPRSGHLLLSSGMDSQIKLWDVYHDKELLRSYSGHSKAVRDVTFNNDGRQFLSASYDRMIKLWDTETGQCISRFTTGKIPYVVKFNPDPALHHEFLTGMSDKKIVQFDIRSGDIIQEYDHHLGPVNTITFCDENRRFITTSDDKSLRAWDYGIPVPIKYVAEPYMHSMPAVALHPNGKYVACQSLDNNVCVFSATDRFKAHRRKTFKGHSCAGYAIDVGFSPDGKFLFSGDSGGYAVFWDWKTCKMWKKWKAHDKPCTVLAMHPQETSKLVTAGYDGLIKYWD
ncbi:hypothetical protein YB2330_006488 [Saitoella coloradoensis]